MVTDRSQSLSAQTQLLLCLFTNKNRTPSHQERGLFSTFRILKLFQLCFLRSPSVMLWSLGLKSGQIPLAVFMVAVACSVGEDGLVWWWWQGALWRPVFSVYRKSSANSGCCSTKPLNLSVGTPQGGARDKTNGLKITGTERLHLKLWPICNSTVGKAS